MLILCRFQFIGLQLLFLTHIAHSFVLLTANMEDIKKIARKFVSDSLADKIADFISKATQNMATNVSEEKEPQEEKEDQVSEENNMYNVERHGFESAAQDAVKTKEEVSAETKTQIEKDEISQSTSEEEKKEFDLPPETTTTQTPMVTLIEQSRYIKVGSNLNQYAYPIQPEKKSQLSEEDEKYEKSKEASKYLEENLIITSTIKSQTLKTRFQKKVKKGRPYRLLANLNSLEENDMAGNLAENNDTLIDDFSENLLFNQKRSFESHSPVSNVELTTVKAAYEFDQYDNKNYKKSTLVATSGPVSLLMPVKKENWWERDLPRRRNDDKDDMETKRKSWF